MHRICLLLVALFAAHAQTRVPRVWDEKGFAGWHLPIAGQKFSAGHFTEAEYYAAPVRQPSNVSRLLSRTRTERVSGKA